MYLSVVMELENAGLAGCARAVTVLRTLADQLCQAPPSLVEQSEFLLGYDPSDWSLESVRRIVTESGIESAVDHIVFLEQADADYFALKNAGAESASGDVILFLDSDVIPEPEWLETMLRAFAVSGAPVVGSHCYIDGVDLISRAYALFGTFPLRDETCGNEVFLNSLAVRPWVMKQFPFPRLPLFRNSAHLWKRELVSAGVRVLALADARVVHPAPAGVIALFRRSLSDGHDHYASRRYGEDRSRVMSLVIGLTGCGLRTIQKTARTLRKGPATGLNMVEMPAALGLCLLSHGARVLGCVASFVRDGATSRHIGT